MHHAELGPTDDLNRLLPGLGRDWGEFVVSQSAIVYNMLVYASHWELVAARWAGGDYALLQPLMASWFYPLLMVQNLLKQKVAKKKLELCGTPCSMHHQLLLAHYADPSICLGKY